jgi:hypothetical protein
MSDKIINYSIKIEIGRGAAPLLVPNFGKKRGERGETLSF